MGFFFIYFLNGRIIAKTTEFCGFLSHQQELAMGNNHVPSLPNIPPITSHPTLLDCHRELFEFLSHTAVSWMGYFKLYNHPPSSVSSLVIAFKVKNCLIQGHVSFQGPLRSLHVMNHQVSRQRPGYLILIKDSLNDSQLRIPTHWLRLSLKLQHISTSPSQNFLLHSLIELDPEKNTCR